jgi:hypothetical protein
MKRVKLLPCNESSDAHINAEKRESKGERAASLGECIWCGIKKVKPLLTFLGPMTLLLRTGRHTAAFLVLLGERE